MNARFRFLAGLAATLALALSVTGGVAASACAAAVELEHAGGAVEADASHGRGGDETSEDCAESHGSSGESDPWCPMAPGAGPTCNAAALLPGLAAAMSDPSSAESRDVPLLVNEPHLLLAAVLYHPPKS